MRVCINCGRVGEHLYNVMVILIFYENMYKMKRKSLYNRKYHINNVIIKLCEHNYVNFYDERKLMPIVKEIDKVLLNTSKLRE